MDIESHFIREASMSAMSIGIGLTQLRKYNFAQIGYFYNALYSITTGMERLLKIIFIYDFRLKNNDSIPNNYQIKQFGHNIEQLYDNAVKISTAHSFNIDTSFYKNDNIYVKVINLLSDFAKETRYYNLDIITGKTSSKAEPLNEWDSKINTEILNRHYRPSKKRLEEIKLMTELLNGHMLVRHEDETGKDINTQKKFLNESDKSKMKQKYSVYYVYILIRFLSKLLTELEYKGNFYPYLREFFQIFEIEDKSVIIGRKTWDIYHL